MVLLNFNSNLNLTCFSTESVIQQLRSERLSGAVTCIAGFEQFSGTAPVLLLTFIVCVSAVPPASAENCVSPDDPVTVLKTHYSMTLRTDKRSSRRGFTMTQFYLLYQQTVQPNLIQTQY